MFDYDDFDFQYFMEEDQREYKNQESNYVNDYQSEIRVDDETSDSDTTGYNNSRVLPLNTRSFITPTSNTTEPNPIREQYEPRLDIVHYKFPTLDLLWHSEEKYIDQDAIEDGKNLLIRTLMAFGIEIETINCIVGPTTTFFEMTLASGTQFSELVDLEEDLAFAFRVNTVSVIKLPEKGTIGIAVPNAKPHILSIGSVLNTRIFAESRMELPVALGRTITNETFVFDLIKAPHILISGSSGTGKSVALHVIITSLLYKKHPAELKLVLMDPNGAEFGNYEIIKRHFLASNPYSPTVINKSRDALSTLDSLCTEMEYRYQLLKMANARSVQAYNELFKDRVLNPDSGHRYLPYIVVVIDSYNTLIMGYEGRMIQYLSKLARYANITGIHLVISSIMPTDDVLPFDIKRSLATRISFKVPEKSDSQVIIDCSGAEKLSNPGDILFKSVKNPIHIHCAFIDTPEIYSICQYISRQPGYTEPYPLPN